MERLTQRIRTGEVLMASDYEEKYTEQEWINVLQNRLAAYEDTGLTPEEVPTAVEMAQIYSIIEENKRYRELNVTVERLKELAKADRAGRLVVLPCKVGDTVWAIPDGKKHSRECKVDFVNIGGFGTTIVLGAKNGLREQYGVVAAAFGKTVFLTREEAEIGDDDNG